VGLAEKNPDAYIGSQHYDPTSPHYDPEDESLDSSVEIGDLADPYKST